MPFDWMNAPVIPDAAAFRGQAERALRGKARLLYRLGYDAAYAAGRCKADLAWEYEMSGPAPLDEAAVEALVDAVYDRESSGTAAPVAGIEAKAKTKAGSAGPAARRRKNRA